MKISTLITDALIELNVISPTDEPSPEDHSFALRTLNRIVKLYNTQNLFSAFTQNIRFLKPIDGWTSPISIGEGQQFPSRAPIHIGSAFFRQGGGADYKIEQMSNDQWASISFKNIKAIPTRFYIQKMDENRMKIYFDVTPMDSLELHLLCKLPINDGVDFLATDNIIFQDGVEKLLMNRLSLELCATYEINMNTIQVIAGKVQEAEKIVKTYNYEPLTMRSNRTLTGKRRNTRNRARW